MWLISEQTMVSRTASLLILVAIVSVESSAYIHNNGGSCSQAVIVCIIITLYAAVMDRPRNLLEATDATGPKHFMTISVTSPRVRYLGFLFPLNLYIFVLCLLFCLFLFVFSQKKISFEDLI